MEINKNNYEAFLLDLIEGKLSAEERNAVLLFLEQHPEIEFDYDLSLPELVADGELNYELKNNLKRLSDEQEERVVYYLDGGLSHSEKMRFEVQLQSDASLQALVKQYENIKLEPETIAFPLEMATLFKFTPQEDELISYTEGLLEETKAKEVLLRAQTNTTLSKEIQAYKSTKSYSDLSVVYPNKDELKKSAIVVFLRTNASYLSIAASLILFFIVFYPSNEKQVSLASLTDKTSFKTKTFTNKDLNSTNVIKSNPIEQFTKESSNVLANYKTVIDSSIAKKSQEVIKDNNTNVEPLLLASNNANVSSKETATRPYNPVIINYYDEKDVEPVAQNQTKRTETSIVNKLQNAAWENVGNNTSDEVKSKSKRMNVLALIGNGLKKIGVKKSGAQKIYHEDEDYVEYNVNIAGITISKKELN